MYRYVLVSLVLLFVACGGGGGGGFDPARLSGEYQVQTEVDDRVGGCAFTSLGDPADFVDGMATVSLTGTEVTLTSEGPISELTGSLLANGFEASATIPLGGMGAAGLETVWTQAESGFSVVYEYREGFISGPGCTISFSGVANRVS